MVLRDLRQCLVLAFLLLVIVAPGRMIAQDEQDVNSYGVLLPVPGAPPLPVTDPDFPSRIWRVRRIDVVPTYAGKYEPRIGGSSESARDKLRLDIGASMDLYSDRERGQGSTGLGIGADFFTWTRLRDAGGFKFPVEAVDYYFGINTTYTPYASLIGIPSSLRLRIAHISAHLVDGDPSFSTDGARYMTYSREFIDLMIGSTFASFDWNKGGSGSDLIDPGHGLFYYRPYFGAQYLFHTIPDTLGRFTPYVGIDIYSSPFTTELIRFQLGYEGRVNNELESIVENLLRLGVRFGQKDGAAILLEASYYRGRSHYGQRFHEMEEYSSLGFAIDF